MYQNILRQRADLWLLDNVKIGNFPFSDAAEFSSVMPSVFFSFSCHRNKILFPQLRMKHKNGKNSFKEYVMDDKHNTPFI